MVALVGMMGLIGIVVELQHHRRPVQLTLQFLAAVARAMAKPVCETLVLLDMQGCSGEDNRFCLEKQISQENHCSIQKISILQATLLIVLVVANNGTGKTCLLRIWSLRHNVGARCLHTHEPSRATSAGNNPSLFRCLDNLQNATRPRVDDFPIALLACLLHDLASFRSFRHSKSSRPA